MRSEQACRRAVREDPARAAEKASGLLSAGAPRGEAAARRRAEATPAQGEVTNRLSDDRYCAPCGILFWQVKDAHQHRREQHPEQARYEQCSEGTPAAPTQLEDDEMNDRKAGE